jgi:uncharacterized membrane protein
MIDRRRRWRMRVDRLIASTRGVEYLAATTALIFGIFLLAATYDASANPWLTYLNQHWYGALLCIAAGVLHLGALERLWAREWAFLSITWEIMLLVGFVPVLALGDSTVGGVFVISLVIPHVALLVLALYRRRREH